MNAVTIPKTDAQREYMRAYRVANKDRIYAQTKEWKRRNPASVHRYKCSSYGLSVDQYNAMFDVQNGCCAICLRHQKSLHRGLHIDHDHTTDKVRALLCFRCNTLLGKVKDDPRILRSAIAFLEKHNGV